MTAPRKFDDDGIEVIGPEDLECATCSWIVRLGTWQRHWCAVPIGHQLDALPRDPRGTWAPTTGDEKDYLLDWHGGWPTSRYLGLWSSTAADVWSLLLDGRRKTPPGGELPLTATVRMFRRTTFYRFVPDADTVAAMPCDLCCAPAATYRRGEYICADHANHIGGADR